MPHATALIRTFRTFRPDICQRHNQARRPEARLNLPPEPTHLTAVQAMRWREAARVLADPATTHINDLDDAGRILAVDRLRGALLDMLNLASEAPPPPPSIE